MRKSVPIPEAQPIAESDPLETQRTALRNEQRRAARRKGRGNSILSRNNSLSGGENAR